MELSGQDSLMYIRVGGKMRKNLLPRLSPVSSAVALLSLKEEESETRE